MPTTHLITISNARKTGRFCNRFLASDRSAGETSAPSSIFVNSVFIGFRSSQLETVDMTRNRPTMIATAVSRIGIWSLEILIPKMRKPVESGTSMMKLRPSV